MVNRIVIYKMKMFHSLRKKSFRLNQINTSIITLLQDMLPDWIECHKYEKRMHKFRTNFRLFIAPLTLCHTRCGNSKLYKMHDVICVRWYVKMAKLNLHLKGAKNFRMHLHCLKNISNEAFFPSYLYTSYLHF